MNNASSVRAALAVLILFLGSSVHAASPQKAALAFAHDGVSARFGVKYKPEAYWSKNAYLLNGNNSLDQVFYSRHTLDFTLDGDYDNDVVRFKIGMRTKGNWGNPDSILSTREAETSLLGALGRPHSHSIPRHLMWVREGWLKLDLREFLHLGLPRETTITLGAFPFSVGRGIALGDAYGVGQGLLGFYTNNVIDQFALGAKISGPYVEDKLYYDFYVSLVNNESESIGSTGAKIYGNAFGRKDSPARGFGSIDFISAYRLNWYALKDERYGAFRVEPYVVYNHAPEQTVEFPGDASSRMVTVGSALEFKSDRFEANMEYAANFGEQNVLGWDRNVVQTQNGSGTVQLVNNHVVTSDPNTNASPAKQLFFSGANQTAIQDAPQGSVYNGELIPSTALYNSLNRFRDAYTNKFRGRMLVIDAAFFSRGKEVRIGTEWGLATGDESPNADLNSPSDSNVDGDYKGFVGLQEIYSGKTVKSVYTLGKLPRPLTAPYSKDSKLKDRFARKSSNFTNLIYWGCSMDWKPEFHNVSGTKIQPNVLLFWQAHPSKKFDINAGASSTDYARTFYGVEYNVFFETKPITDLRVFLTASLFVPGGHYDDIRGKPINSEQAALLDRLDRTGYARDALPLIGTSAAYTLSSGMEYSF